MYTTRSRKTSRLTFSGTGSNGSSSPIGFGFSSPQFLEGVYSWRTGARNIADPAGTPAVRQKRQDAWGLITPSKPGSLVQRKQYLEDFSRMMVPAETDAGAISTSRTSTTDTGHPFGSLKILRTPARGFLDYYDSGSFRYIGDIWDNFGQIVNVTPYTYGLPSGGSSPLVVSSVNRQAMANRYFAATAPDRKVGSIGMTLIELLRGDVPSLLKNFQSMMSGYKTVRNYVGSEGLNIMFGWTPLIQEWANIIKVGMGLERVIYYESFRRKRQWDGPSFRSEQSYNSVLSFLRSGWVSDSLLPGETAGPTSGFGVSYSAQGVTVANEDYHLSSKYTGLAKAGRRAESFSDQAMDVAKRMGAIDDPELIWDLTPYSWLLDWFTTMGESIHNAQVYNPMVGKYSTDYAYMTTKHTVTYSSHLLRRLAISSKVRSTSLTSGYSSLTSVSKWRARATPFGFGTQLGSLNASQFAVLVALGFAKTR